MHSIRVPTPVENECPTGDQRQPQADGVSCQIHLRLHVVVLGPALVTHGLVIQSCGPGADPQHLLWLTGVPASLTVVRNVSGRSPTRTRKRVVLAAPPLRIVTVGSGSLPLFRPASGVCGWCLAAPSLTLGCPSRTSLRAPADAVLRLASSFRSSAPSGSGRDAAWLADPVSLSSHQRADGSLHAFFARCSGIVTPEHRNFYLLNIFAACREDSAYFI